MKLISIVTPCYNEEENVVELYSQVKEVFNSLPQYAYEHIFIDNSSTDNTVKLLKSIARVDKNLKIIVNTRNFGCIRSPHYGLLQVGGDAAIAITANLQEPPVLIKEFIKKWEDGFKIVIGIKSKSEENPLMFAVRRVYYNLIKAVSDIEQVKNFSGFGLYDRQFIEVLKKLNEPYPYFRGLVMEVGFKRAEVEFTRPRRKRGKSHSNLYTLYDAAILGIVNHSLLPLRLITFTGFILAGLSFLIAFVYLIYKILFWQRFPLGISPLLVGYFLFFAVQLIFIGLIGEYIGAIYTQVKNRPLVIEKERINFDK